MADARSLELSMVVAESAPRPLGEPPAASDESLLASFLTNRNPEAFNQLVLRYQHFAFRVAYCHCSNAALAEEAVQEAFLQIAKPGSQFSDAGPGSFKVWLYTVVSNVARNLSRTERRIMNRTVSRRYQDDAQQRSAEKRAAEGKATLERGETGRALEDALSGLQEELRLPIVLHYLEGLTQTEIGNLAGISQSLVARRIASGLELLKKRLVQGGIAFSVSALPEILKGSQLLQAPPSLQGLLSRLNEAPIGPSATARGYADASRSSRSLGTPAIPWMGIVAAGVALAACGALWYGLSAPAPSTVVAPVYAAREQRATPSPFAPLAAAPLPKEVFWDFDSGLLEEQFKRPGVPLEGVPDWPLPKWIAGKGQHGTGALYFAGEGSSLFLSTGIPVTQLPVRLEFDLLALDADKCQFGVSLKFKTSLKQSLDVKLELHAKRGGWNSQHWTPWLRQLVEEPAGSVLSKQWYGEEAIGHWSVEPKSAYWLDPQCEIHFELHGQHALVDNLRIRFGKGLAATLPASSK